MFLRIKPRYKRHAFSVVGQLVIATVTAVSDTSDPLVIQILIPRDQEKIFIQVARSRFSISIGGRRVNFDNVFEEVKSPSG